MKSTEDYSYWYKIVCYNGKYPNSGAKEILYWDNMPFDVRVKWNWYFEYRHALLKVQNPKSKVDSVWGKKERTNATPEEIEKEKNIRRRTTIKRKITQFQNAIKKYEQEQKLKLIPDFENPKYIRTVEKLKEYQAELDNISKEIITEKI